MKRILIIIAMAFFGMHANAQVETLHVKTSAVCEMCKEILEKDLSFEKGVKKAELDLGKNVIAITYRADKTSPEKIRMAITRSGYAADSLPPDPKAYKRLPDCCKADSGVEHPGHK